jgi:hypothetical protein
VQALWERPEPAFPETADDLLGPYQKERFDRRLQSFKAEEIFKLPPSVAPAAARGGAAPNAGDLQRCAEMGDTDAMVQWRHNLVTGRGRSRINPVGPPRLWKLLLIVVISYATWKPRLRISVTKIMLGAANPA